MLKNQTKGYTEGWKKERQRQLDFINSQPYYGSPIAEKMYKAFKNNGVNVLQVSVCGCVVGVVTYKQDADKMFTILQKSFNKTPKQITCSYTNLVTTSIINR